MKKLTFVQDRGLFFIFIDPICFYFFDATDSFGAIQTAGNNPLIEEIGVLLQSPFSFTESYIV